VAIKFDKKNSETIYAQLYGDWRVLQNR